jgi:hypothetical protein
MIKILHFNICKNMPIGVFNQLQYEYNSVKFLAEDVSWNIKVFSHDECDSDFCEKVIRDKGASLISQIKNYQNLRKTSYCWLTQSQSKYDAVLLRYRSGDIYQYHASKKFKNVFTIHHSKEIEQAGSLKTLGGYVESILEQYYGPKVLRSTLGVIGLTQEIVDYELARIKSDKPSFCYSNGINLDDYEIAEDKRTDKIKLLFIASLDAAWHGVDLLLDKMAKSAHQYELHMVGPFLKDKYPEDIRFKFHGNQDSNFIRKLAAECDIGLSSFALFRKGMREACTLKVREYLAQGLPVYSGHIDSGLPVDFQFYKSGPLDSEKILSYAETCKNISRNTVREMAAPYIDKLELMKKLVDWIKFVKKQ